jgi:hypothetical protein
MIEVIIAVLLAIILVVLIEGRITVGTRVAVMERDLSWISASLVKWGMVVPRDSGLEPKA